MPHLMRTFHYENDEMTYEEITNKNPELTIEDFQIDD